VDGVDGADGYAVTNFLVRVYRAKYLFQNWWGFGIIRAGNIPLDTSRCVLFFSQKNCSRNG
jgi:hypothetical protein